MTKVAQLHNGHELHFPDETPDHEIDAAVQRHLGQPQLAPGADNVMKALLQAVGTHIAAQSAAENNVSAQHQKDKQAEYSLHAVTAAHKVAAVNDAGSKVSASVQHLTGNLLPAIVELAKNSGQVGNLILAINNLSAIVLEVGKGLIRAHTTPKEIYHGEDGKPKGVRPMTAPTTNKMQ